MLKSIPNMSGSEAVSSGKFEENEVPGLGSVGDEGAEIPALSKAFLFSLFSAFNSLSDSSLARLSSLASAVKFGLPERVDDVEANQSRQDMNHS